MSICSQVLPASDDPAWDVDRPAEFNEYWNAFSFGELTEMANNRKSILERMLPRLPIHERFRIDGRFPVVEGDRAT